MPTWSLNELITWNKVLQVKFKDGSSLHEQYRLIGGNVNVLEDPDRTASLKQEVITKVDSLGLKDILKLQDPFFIDPIHPFPLTSISGCGPNYENYEAKLASQWVIELVGQRLLALLNSPDFFNSENEFYLLKFLNSNSDFLS